MSCLNSKVIDSVSIDLPEDVVNAISIPRHFVSETDNNRFVKEWVFDKFEEFGYKTFYQGNSWIYSTNL